MEKKCPSCGGKGFKNCIYCGGAKLIPVNTSKRSITEYANHFEPCPQCQGGGAYVCAYCKGSGSVKVEGS